MYTKKYITIIIQTLAIIISSIIIGTILLLLVYLIPTERLELNVHNSISVFDEKIIDNWAGSEAYAKLSNFSDSIMINIAIYRPYGSVIDNALLAPFAVYDEEMSKNLVRLVKGGVMSILWITQDIGMGTFYLLFRCCHVLTLEN